MNEVNNVPTDGGSIRNPPEQTKGYDGVGIAQKGIVLQGMWWRERKSTDDAHRA